MKKRKRQPSRVDDYQFLLVSQVNYTMTYFAARSEEWSHDAVKRYLMNETLSGKEVWEHSKGLIETSEQGYVVIDDFVLDKDYSQDIERVRHLYSGKEKTQINGIGIVTCMYVNPERGRYWLIDYRIYDPERDGKSKIVHAKEMLENIVNHKQLEFGYVTFDAWYSKMELLKKLEGYGKIYYCTIKGNRNVCEQTSFSPGEEAHYQRADELLWSRTEEQSGKLVHLHTFPKGHTVKLFRLVLSDKRTDYLITNEVTQHSTQAAQEAFRPRWCVEQFHREVQQVTGIDQCQARLVRIQRNHIACSFLVWNRLSFLAHHLRTSVYALKQNLLDDYMKQQLRSPSLHMGFV
ncbi:MAG: IS701 family transposase [Trueperaceae bacterium]